ncbi:MAG: DinB family protein [Clostridia bacterium]|nr:DinB family protein [Clostridia bacterium]
MNREWSDLNKTMQLQIKKKETYEMGLSSLFALRKQLMDTILSFYQELSREDFDAIPFLGAEGYHSKTIAYSLWHIFRIEDIVAHTLISGDTQTFFAGDYQRRTGSPIITTGNELKQDRIADFSRQLDLDGLYSYLSDVRASTERIVRGLAFEDLKRKITDDRKEELKALHAVSEDEDAVWLIDYWCGKDIRGLIQMPFSRHWIMHIEACLRIKNRIRGQRRRIPTGADKG